MSPRAPRLGEDPEREMVSSGTDRTAGATGEAEAAGGSWIHGLGKAVWTEGQQVTVRAVGKGGTGALEMSRAESSRCSWGPG